MGGGQQSLFTLFMTLNLALMFGAWIYDVGANQASNGLFKIQENVVRKSDPHISSIEQK